MANRIFYPSNSGALDRVYIDFELLGAGAAALTLSTDAAQFVSGVTRSGAGIYVVTLKDAWSKIIYKSAEMDDTLNDGAYATCSDPTNESTATPLKFTIRTRAAAGTAADAAAARRIGVSLILRNGNVGLT
jgi:hypothetical protein